MSISSSAIPKSIYFLALAFLLSGCTTSTTQLKAPFFTKDTAAIMAQMQGIMACERIIINGTQTTTNNNTATSELLISFINANNDSKKMEETAKTIAAQLKQSLRDPNEFDSYKVIFVKKKGLASFSADYVYPKSDL